LFGPVESNGLEKPSRINSSWTPSCSIVRPGEPFAVPGP
jgi:hypothetical protein